MSDPLADLARLEGVASAVAAARDAVDAVLRDRGLRRVSAEQAAQARWSAAQASAELTGAPERWLPGTVRLAAEAASLASMIRVAPAQALARAHTLAAYDAVPPTDLGRVRSSAEVTERLGGLTRLLTSSSAASAVVLAAITHAEVATMTAFGSADGVIGRAAERMVLMSSGVDPDGMIIVEAGHLSSGTYDHDLDAYVTGGTRGVREWLLHCCRALGRGAELSPLNPSQRLRARERG